MGRNICIYMLVQHTDDGCGFLLFFFPAGTWHHFDVKQTLKLSHDVEKPDINVILTSMCLRRIDVKSMTSIRR